VRPPRLSKTRNEVLKMATRGARPSQEAANAKLGLKLLGLRLDSHSSVLHKWAQRLPYGMFDGHGSVFPAPDHLIFHGLARCCFKALFKALPTDLRKVVAASLREALAQCGYKRTRVYNSKRDKVNGLQIQEWAAVLTVGSIACRRVLYPEIRGVTLVTSSVGVMLDTIDSLADFAAAAFFYPRVELDGGRTCRARYDTTRVQACAERFLVCVNEVCRRPDCDGFSSILDVPNTHRFRELLHKTVGVIDAIRDILELPLESFHQPLKRSIVRGNGRNDASRAFSRYVEQEAVSRLCLDPSVLGVRADWCATPGVRQQLQAASPLWSQESDDWVIGREELPARSIPAGAERHAADLPQISTPIHWRSSCTRGQSERLIVGDAVAVLTTGFTGGQIVDVAVGPLAYSNDAVVSFFSVCAFLKLPCGQPGAIVCPFSRRDERGTCSLNSSMFLFMRLQVGVRRALRLHGCGGEDCSTVAEGGMAHSGTNKWHVLGRQDGYPSRSG